MNHPAPRTEFYSGRFYSLDALRGLAALSVILFHWQHFFCVGTIEKEYDPSRLPLYFLFKPFYTEGWRAVDLFFCLSGFIFFWLYAERIRERRISLVEFARLRFSRLYPLHLVTLLFVAIGQVVMFHSFGTFFVYPCNDLYHFVLQLVLASGWGLERGYSFNEPVWSVSVEVLLYAIFFLVCVARFTRWWHLLLLLCLGQSLLLFGLLDVSRGVISFFVGALTYRVFLHLSQRHFLRFILLALLVMTAALWIVIPLGLQDDFYVSYERSMWRGLVVFHDQDLLGLALFVLIANAYNLFLFPLTILTLALAETYRGTLGRRLSFLGDLSYSLYLLHFPLQLTIIFLALCFSLPRTIFYSPLVLLAFYGLLIPLSLCSYHFFERPLQTFLRQQKIPHPSDNGSPRQN